MQRLHLALALALATVACTGVGDDGDAPGLHIDTMSPEQGLQGGYRLDDTEITFAARVESVPAAGLHAEVRGDDGALLASLEGDFAAPPVMVIGGIEVGPAGPDDGDAAALADLLASPDGAALAALVAELPWHVDGMHHEFLAIQQLYATLRLAAGAGADDDGFSFVENQRRVAVLTAAGAEAGRLQQASTAQPNFPDMYICPGMPDKCVGMCGAGCQGSFGIQTYTCDCLRHDLWGDVTDPSALTAAMYSLQDPTSWRTRTQLDAGACSPDYTPQSPAYFCSIYGASRVNARSDNSDGQWWCFDAYPGETQLSPGPQNLMTDYHEHWGWIPYRYTYIRSRDGTVVHFDQPGRIKMGISGKASGIVIARINPGSALCNLFGGTCEVWELNTVSKEMIEYLIDHTPGCYRTSGWGGTGTTQTTGATCPDFPFYHAFGSHGFGWYDALNIPPGDYMIGASSQSVVFGTTDGHATFNIAAYQGNGGNWQPPRSGMCGAVAGDGYCDGGENGWSAPQDCCDAATACDRSYRDQGQLWCRSMAGGGYQWLSDAAPWCDEGDEIGTTAACGRGTYQCTGLPNQWAQVQQCGNGACEPDWGESWSSCPGDCPPSCSYGSCAEAGWPSGFCQDGWQCTDPCIDYTGCSSCAGPCAGGWIWSGDCQCYPCEVWAQYCWGNGFSDPICWDVAGSCGF
ncbi:MAG TPA: hypothetical protein VL172_23305 [Kofleriaceae bacterium]|jgi:hypothetical protein|nr:hypothetical protein [Kofleriaceae bacterium]